MAHWNNPFIHQLFQFSSNSSGQQLRSHGGDASYSNQNYTSHMPYVQGGSVNRGLLEVGSMDGLGYEYTSSSSFAVLSQPSFYHHNYYPPPSVQSIYGFYYDFYHQFSGPLHGHSMNGNVHHNTINHSRESLQSMRRHPRHFSSSEDQIMDFGLLYAEDISARLRVMPVEEVAVLESFVMQPNNVDMSYEELLDLGEEIGNANTGLSEGTILKCVRTRLHASCSTSYPLGQSSEMEQEDSICIICQAEYEENDNIGTLGCGHEFHVNCINQWLLMKNLCPVCRRPANNNDD